MIKFLDILNEGSYDDEGVADKLYPKFRVDADAENIKALKNLERIEREGMSPVAWVKNTKIFLNPQNLKYFSPDIRAIGDIKGNLFVAQTAGKYSHDDMGEALGINMERNENIMRLIRPASNNKFINTAEFEDKEKGMAILNALKHHHPHFDFISLGL